MKFFLVLPFLFVGILCLPLEHEDVDDFKPSVDYEALLGQCQNERLQCVRDMERCGLLPEGTILIFAFVCFLFLNVINFSKSDDLCNNDFFCDFDLNFTCSELSFTPNHYSDYFCCGTYHYIRLNVF